MSDYCLTEIQGYRIYLHFPNEVPQVTKHFFLAAHQRHTQLLINPSMTITTPELRDMAIEKRPCYFSDERRLDYFRSYTQSNCEIECVVVSILSYCECLVCYMPSQHIFKYIRLIFQNRGLAVTEADKSFPTKFKCA
jgi:acid-sensing ion channel, other